MNTNQKREAIKGAYKRPKWFERVDRMSEAQVHAVYMSLLRQGKI